jgi:acyl-[acyl-carrier-protein]-phospholipid O-acyltransferase / long-chain-fatty-acid--[acyl-carrier-protein] ligase
LLALKATDRGSCTAPLDPRCTTHLKNSGFKNLEDETRAMSLETSARPAEAIEPTPDVKLAPLPDDWRSLPRAFVHAARSRAGATAICDSTGVSLTYGQTLMRSLALGRALARVVGEAPYVGLLVPPTVPGAVANLALALWGKIPVNLNYTASEELVNDSIDQCGITHIVTSKKALAKFKMQPKGNLIYLEDLPQQITMFDKIWAACVSKLVPISALGAFVPGLRNDQLDATATVIFTSGSTGDPKGVVLSHRNVLSNIHQMNSHLQILPDEVVLGILPFFHSFGYTITIWTVLCLGKKAVYHFNPLDARVIGELCQKHHATLLACTPTFMRTYLQRCDRAQFASIVHLLLGAEKLKPELDRDIRSKLGIEPLEGFGCTETAPVIAVNVPQQKRTVDGRTVAGNRPGTVGMPLPGTAIKTIDPETGAELPRGKEGVILVKGPQVMVGYLNRPEATAKVLHDGWYTTGDLGYLDADGFLKITDRLSRFSKIAGEMVPHLGVESAIQEATGAQEQSVAVTSLADARRGERLAVLYTDLGMTPEDVYKRLSESALPRLWIPSADAFVKVDAIPILGTGKVDLRRLKQIAEERLGA